MFRKAHAQKVFVVFLIWEVAMGLFIVKITLIIGLPTKQRDEQRRSSSNPFAQTYHFDRRLQRRPLERLEQSIVDLNDEETGFYASQGHTRSSLTFRSWLIRGNGRVGVRRWRNFLVSLTIGRHAVCNECNLQMKQPNQSKTFLLRKFLERENVDQSID